MSSKASKKKTKKRAADALAAEPLPGDEDTEDQPEAEPQMSTTPPGLPPLVPTGGLGLPDITPAQAAQESGPLKYLLTRQQQIKGNAEFLKGDMKAALTCYTKAIAFSASNPPLLARLLTLRARARWVSMEYQKALDDCMAAIQCDPNWAKAYVCRGNCYLCLDKLTLAADDYNMALRLTSDQEKRTGLEEVLVAIAERAQQVPNPPKPRPKSVAASRGAADVEWFRTHGLLDLDDDLLPVDAPTPPSAATLPPTAASPVNSTAAGASPVAAATPTFTAPSFTSPSAPLGQMPPAVASALSSAMENALPALIPAGEFANIGPVSAELADAPRKIDRATKEKEAGNQSYGSENFLAALVHYSNAIKLFPHDPVFYSNRALVYIKLNRFHEAISDCTASIERKPSIKAYARRAAGWASLNRFALAAEDYKRALKFEPRNQDCLQELHKCLVFMVEDAEAELKENPQHEGARKTIKRAQEDLKQYIAPLRAAAAAAGAGGAAPAAPASTPTPATAVPHPTTGTSSAKPNPQAERAIIEEIIDWSRKLEQDPNDSHAYLNRAIAYIKRGDIDKAITDCRFGLLRDPDNQELRETLKVAVAHKKTGTTAKQ